MRTQKLATGQDRGHAKVTDLENLDVRCPVRSVSAPVPLDVFEPLDVWLRITVDFALELDVTAHYCCGVGR